MIGLEDEWIASHQELAPEKMHALGCVALYWNRCEFALLDMLGVIAGTPWQRLVPMVHDLSSNQMWARVTYYAAGSLSPGMIEHVEHARRMFDVCRLNRNAYLHAAMRASSEIGTGEPFVLAKLKGAEYEPKAISSDIDTIRRVADDIINLKRYITSVAMTVSFARMSEDPPSYEPHTSLDKPSLPKSVL